MLVGDKKYIPIPFPSGIGDFDVQVILILYISAGLALLYASLTNHF
jgi:hypothetical protein